MRYSNYEHKYIKKAGTFSTSPECRQKVSEETSQLDPARSVAKEKGNWFVRGKRLAFS